MTDPIRVLIADDHSLVRAGLIAFDSFGALIVSSQLDAKERNRLGIDRSSLRKKLPEKSANYLAFHRENRFRD